MANLGAINNVYQGALGDDAGHGVSPQGLYSYLTSQGANPNEALLLTGAGTSESRLNPNAVHDGGVDYGLYGHNGSRLLAMQHYAQQTGQPISDWRTQASFALNELRSRPEGKAASNATSPEQLTLAQMYFERPQGFSEADPEAGHNFTGRLNQIRAFTSLNPNAAGAFAPGSNPQVTPQMLFGSNAPAPSVPATQPPATAPAANPFAKVGNPTLNALAAQAAAGITNKLQTSGDVPLVTYLAGRVTQPAVEALSHLLSGGVAKGPQSSLPTMARSMGAPQSGSLIDALRGALPGTSS